VFAEDDKNSPNLLMKLIRHGSICVTIRLSTTLD